MSTSCNSFPVYIMKVDRILPSCKMEGQIELCTKGCNIAVELHKTIKPLQTLLNYIHVHPGERRGAHRKILTKILIFFISIHINYIKLRQYHSI